MIQLTLRVVREDGRTFRLQRADFWVNLQSIHDLRIAERKTGKAIQALPTTKRVTALHA